MSRAADVRRFVWHHRRAAWGCLAEARRWDGANDGKAEGLRALARRYFDVARRAPARLLGEASSC